MKINANHNVNVARKANVLHTHASSNGTQEVSQF